MIDVRKSISGAKKKVVGVLTNGYDFPTEAITRALGNNNYSTIKVLYTFEVKRVDFVFIELKRWKNFVESRQKEVRHLAHSNGAPVYVYEHATQNIVEAYIP